MHLVFAAWDDPTAPGCGGVASYVRRLGGALAAAGVQVTALVLRRASGPGAAGGLRFEPLRRGRLHGWLARVPGLGPLTALPARELEDGWTLRRALLRLHARSPIDVCEGIETGSLGLLGLPRRIRTCIRLHGERYTFACHMRGRPGLELRWSRALQLQALRGVQHLSAPSAAHAAVIQRELAGNAPAPAVIPHPLASDYGGAVRRSVSVAAPAGRLLYVGRLQDVKGVLPLLRAFAVLRRSRPGLRLELVGSFHHSLPEAGLRRLCQRLGIAAACSFRGPLSGEELRVAYRSADLVVVPSYYESFGYVCLEALACGVPVVASRTGVAAELIEPGRDGYLVAPGDAGELARACARALRGGLCVERGQLRRFAPEVVAARMRAFYEDLLRQH